MGFDVCCPIGLHNKNYLAIPALMATEITIRLPNMADLRIQQDGFLRPFAPATLLWPAGYLLAQYLAGLATPEKPTPFKAQRVLELGCGVGLASIVASSLGGQVVATDREVRSL